MAIPNGAAAAAVMYVASMFLPVGVTATNEIVGGGGYDQLAASSIPIEVFGIGCLCLDLERLIQVKRAAGRPKDLDAIAELEVILEERTKTRS